MIGCTSTSGSATADQIARVDHLLEQGLAAEVGKLSLGYEHSEQVYNNSLTTLNIAGRQHLRINTLSES